MNKFEYNIPINRLKHCYMVGKVMEYVSREILKNCEEKNRELFFIGLIHDSMYDFETNEYLHNEIISDLITNYSRELKEHSKITNNYSSTELDLLYFADQIVDGYGNIVSFDERIEDIKNRHGLNDGIYNDTIEIVDYLLHKEINGISYKTILEMILKDI